MGFVTYRGKFIPVFATITKTPRRLTHHEVDFGWNEEQESTFSIKCLDFHL